jgi:hypothetical protein
MSWKEKIILADTFTASADITNALGKFVKHGNTTSGFNGVASAASDLLAGVIYVGGAGDGTTQFNATISSGDLVHVALAGKVMIRAGAAFNAGVELTADSSGRGVAASSGNVVRAVALTAATAANELVPALLTGLYYKA